jgi:hypothetical protein
MIKHILIILSTRFPLYHKRRRKETHFKESFLVKRKIHTIRSGYDRWAHNIDKVINGDFTLSLREWSGRPYDSPQREIASLKEDVGYQRITMSYDPRTEELEVTIDGKPYNDIKRLAANDGLSVEDFKSFMFGANRTLDKQLFQGIIIHFTKFRYK